MDLGIRDKFALVTGGSHGIGRAIALALADEGCNVAVCARDEQRIRETTKEIEARGVAAIGICADVMISTDINHVITTVARSWGALHILINNVGGGGRWGSDTVEETSEAVWRDVYNKNAMAAVRFTMGFIPYMRKQKWGRVVTVASVYGKEGGGRPWFGMAKSAQITLMKNLAMRKEFVRDGVTFNSVAPGCIMIPGTGWEKERQANPETFDEKLDRDFPLGRLGTPEEVAYVVALLCSEKATLVNGACVTVDGGESRSF